MRVMTSTPGVLYRDEYGEFWVGATDGRFWQVAHGSYSLVPGWFRTFTVEPSPARPSMPLHKEISYGPDH